MKSTFLKIFAIFAIFILTQTGVLAFYSDVPETNSDFNAIKTLSDSGKLPTSPDNLFHPEEIVTKKEFYKILLTYATADLSKDINLPYADIPKDSPYATYIQTALDAKILKPTGDNPIFNQDQAVNKGSALSIIFNTLGFGPNYLFNKTDFPFTDLSPTSMLAPVAKKAADLKILDPADPKKFRKNKNITKGELAGYLYKLTDSPSVKPVEININLDDSYSKTTKDLLQNPTFATLLDIWTNLKKDYYYKDKLDDNQLLLGAIKEMVTEASKESKDKYTVFEKPAQQSSTISRLQSEYVGVGILIELMNNKDITIISPFRGSPAEQAGLRSNDIIIKVDDTSVIGQSLEDASAKIKGPKDTTVKITVLRGGQEAEFTVTRKSIKLTSVDSKKIQIDNGKTIGYLAINNFGANTYVDFAIAAKELTATPPTGLIIDLRNNPGGYVETALNIMSMFSKEQKIAVTLEYSDKRTESMKTSGSGELADYKVVLLVNEGSASASEIMAGAFQDYKTATLIGQKTFGKGSVQQLKQYKDGSLFKFTISKWLTPNGHIINELGVTPDKLVQNVPGGQDAQLDAALREFQ